MKKIIKSLAIALIVLTAAPATAQIKFGIKGGAQFTNIKVESLKTKSATGWFVGPTLEAMLPVVGLGVEGSLFYSRVNSELQPTGIFSGYKNYDVDYLSLPINLKFKLNLPVVKPMIFAGPEFSVRVGDSFRDSFSDLIDKVDMRLSRSDVRFNMGVGVEVLSKVQITVAYNAGVTDTFKDIDSKSNVWRLGLGLYF